MPPSPDAPAPAPIPIPAPAADAGVIHNIGYRSYQGPRLGRAYATRSLYVQSLRAAFGLGRSGRSKVLPMAMLGLPVLVALVIVAVEIFTGMKEPALDYPEFLSVVAVLVWIFLASQAPVLLSRDLRHHTVPLYFSRPITRADYVRAKFAAMTTAVLIVMVAPLLVLYVGALLARMDFGHHTGHLMFGLAAAVLYAVVEASLALLIAASTPRRGFGVAAIMGVLTVSNIVAGIVYGISGGADGANWAAMLSPSMLVQSFVNQVFGLVGGDPNTLHAPGAGGALAFAAEIVLLSAACYWFTDRRYRKI